MKSKKLNLNELKVQSFVTQFEKEKVNTLKGGSNAYPCSVHTEDWGQHCRVK